MDINFVERDRRRVEKTQRQDQKSFIVFFALVMAILTVLLVLLGVKIFFQNQSREISAAVTRAKDQLTADQQNEMEYLVFYHKLDDLASVLDMRHSHTEEAVWDTDFFQGREVAVQRIEYDIYAQQLQLDLRVYSIFYVQDIIDALSQDALQNRYERVESLTLVRNSLGFYTLTITLALR